MSAQDARDRFAAATREHLSAPLGASGDITLRHVDAKTWHDVIEPLWQESQGRPGLDVRTLLDEGQRARLADLDAVMDRLEHRILFERIRNDGSGTTELVGGYWGSQDSEGRYAMVVSVFAPEHRGHGLYSAWLPRVVEAARASGFREMYSRHRADNNPILVPKLKAGFVLAGFEVAPRWGLCIWLRKYLVDAFEQVHQYRIDGTHGDTLRAKGLPVP
jgi:hypothetical protein